MSKINGTKVQKKNELHDIVDWNVDNLVFADPEFCTVPGSTPPLNYIRINILTQNHQFNEDGSIKFDKNGVPLNSNTMGDLTLSFDRMFCYGVTESTSQETKAVIGHQMSFALWSRDGPKEREIKTSKKLEAIAEKAKQHLLSIKKELKKPKLEMSDLKDLSKILYWKEDKDTGERVAGQGPSFSPKLIEYKARVDPKTGKEKPYQMCTIFYHEDEVDENGNPLEVSPLDYLSTESNKRFLYARPAVKIESIFFGAKVLSLQCKVTESDISPVSMGPQRLLHNRHKVMVSDKITTDSAFSGINPLLSMDKSTNDEEDVTDVKKLTIKDEEGELADEPVAEKPKKTLVKKKKVSETE